MNVLFLMAGKSDIREGIYPKNLVEINGVPLIQCVIESFSSLLTDNTKTIFLIDKSENEKYFTKNVVKLVKPGSQIIEVPNITKGALCTALLAIEQVNNEEPLVVINGDIVIEENAKFILNEFIKTGLDGGIITFESVHPRWSYVKCNIEGYVTEIAEKRPISNIATAGVYYFKKGKYFVEGAMNLIRKGSEVNGVYYVSLVYNEMILKHLKIKTYKVDRSRYFSLSKDADIKKYENFLMYKCDRIGSIAYDEE